MTNETNDQPVLITGIGLLSSLGEGVETHWDALNQSTAPNMDRDSYQPYTIHPLAEVDWSAQISRRDMRQMEPWQQIGTYAAGLALEDAGAKEDLDLCGRMDMIVAAGGGERDIEVDSTIMSEGRGKNEHDALLAERLSGDLRPTLFLAQLSNLLAGNISIVHKVTGSSRTFMGEEGAGISAIQTAHARIRSGQSDIVLVGGAFNAARDEMLLSFELGQYLAQNTDAPVWARNGAGFSLGSLGTFLVLESKSHAQARGARAYAQISAIGADHGGRGNHAGIDRLGSLIDTLELTDTPGILSAATGHGEITNAELDFFHSTWPDAAVRAFGSKFGHGVEAQFPLGIALAALAMKNDGFYPPFEEAEKPAPSAPEKCLVTSVGHWRAEGVGLVEPV